MRARSPSGSAARIRRSLEEMDQRAVLVAEKLHLVLSRPPLRSFLDIHLVIAEGSLGLAPCRHPLVKQLVRRGSSVGPCRAAPPPPAAFSMTGYPTAAVSRSVSAGSSRKAAGRRDRRADGLRKSCAPASSSCRRGRAFRLRRQTDEDQARRLARRGKVGISPPENPAAGMPAASARASPARPDPLSSIER